MALKTKEEIALEIEDFIKQKRSDIDITAGSVLHDLAIESVSQEIETGYTDIDKAGKAHSVNYASELTDDEMNDLAANYALTRKEAVKSVSVITFSSYTKPTSIVQIGSDDGLGGVLLATKKLTNGSVVQFVTTQTVYLQPTDLQNPSTKTYDVVAPIEAVVAGTTGNVPANTITVLQQSVPGVNLVKNTIAASGGSDEESNEDLAQRIVLKAQAKQLGTKPGYESLAVTVASVTDAAAVGPNDAEAVRDQFGGEVDVYILGTKPTNYIQTTNYIPGVNDYALDLKPVDSIVQVVGLSLTLPTIFTEGLDWQFVEDDYSVVKKSNRSFDKLSWMSGGNKPDPYSEFEISFIYDKNVEDVQDIFDSEENNLLASDVLIKKAEEILVDIGFTVSILPGYDKTTVRNEIITELTSIINSMKLGDDIDQSDLVFQLRTNVEGIDAITLPFTTLAIRGGSGVTSPLPASLTQYFRTDSNSFTNIVVN